VLQVNIFRSTVCVCMCIQVCVGGGEPSWWPAHLLGPAGAARLQHARAPVEDADAVGVILMKTNTTQRRLTIITSRQ
jgi:hypothetical protein